MAEEEKESRAQRVTARYQEAEGRLKEFLSDPEIRGILLEFERLVLERNQRLDEAQRAVKSELPHLQQDKLVCGAIGAQKRFKREYDAEFLANALPAAQAELILTERVVYDLNVELLQQLLRQGEIDAVIVARSLREEELSPALMPGTPKAYTIPALPVLDE